MRDCVLDGGNNHLHRDQLDLANPDRLKFALKYTLMAFGVVLLGLIAFFLAAVFSFVTNRS